MGMADILFFTSPIGLGHATRDYAISRHLAESSIEFVTGSGAARLFERYHLNVQDVYCPPRFTVRDGALRGRLKWLWRYYRYYRECRQAAESIIMKEPPRLIVSDEDFAALAAGQAAKIPTVLVTDLLETDFVGGPASILERRMNRSMQSMMARCRRVILPEDGADQKNIRRVGPIVRRTAKTRDELRRELEFTRDTILITAGGTDAGRFLIDQAVQATAGSDADVVVVSGPSMDIKCDGVRRAGFVTDMHEWVYAADVVVSLAGRSTMDEAAAYGTPGIFIPIRDHFEQESNARRMGFSYRDINRLSSLIRKMLSKNREPVASDGAVHAAECISDILGEANN